MMFGAFAERLVIVVVTVALTRFGQCHGGGSMMGTSSTFRTLNIVLNAKSWCWDCEDSSDDPLMGNVAEQTVFSAGTIGRYTDSVDVPLRVDRGDVYEKTNAMYEAFGCKCAETMEAIVLELTAKELGVNGGEIVRNLKLFNEQVLKTVTALLHFSQIAPNVRSREPGVLKIAVWLNLNVNNLIEFVESTKNVVSVKNAAKKPKENEIQLNAKETRRRVLMQMSNVLERFTISNCSSTAATATVATVDERGKRSPIPVNRMKKLMKNFNSVLDDSGLAITDFIRYNVTSDLREDTHSEQIRSKGDDSNFNLILHVLSEFHRRLDVGQLFQKPVDRLDVERIFFVQKRMYDFTMAVVYRNLLAFLRRFRDTIPEDESKSSKRSMIPKAMRKVATGLGIVAAIADETPKLPSYLTRISDYVKQEKLVPLYERLLAKAKQLKFPRDFVNCMALVSRVLRDVLCRYDKAHGLDVIIRHVEQNAKFVSPLSNTVSKAGNNSNPDEDLFKDKVATDQNEFELHDFLLKLFSIPYLKQFNQIYRLLRSDFDENDDTAAWKHFNSVQYVTSARSVSEKCEAVMPVYAHCHDVLEKIHGKMVKKEHDELKRGLTVVSDLLDAMGKLKEPGEDGTESLVVYAHQYLSWNVTHYPDAGDVPEKLRRTVYHVTNLLEKYQMHNCAMPNYRDLVFEEFRQNADTKARYLNAGRPKAAAKRKSKTDKTEAAVSGYEEVAVYRSAVEDLKDAQWVSVYWKGEMKTAEEIAEDFDRNVFDFTALAKYAIAVSRWTSLVLLYTVLDVLHYLQREKGGKSPEAGRLDKIFAGLRSVDFPDPWAPAISGILDTMTASNLGRGNPFEMIELRMLLEQHLDRYGHIVRRKPLNEGKLPVHVKTLTAVVDKLKKTWPKGRKTLITPEAV